MVRRRVGICGLLVAIGLACQSAQAGDRRSARREQNSSEEIFGTRTEHTVAAKYELSGASAARASKTGSSGSAGLRPSRHTGTPTEDAPARERQRLTLFRINSNFGGIGVEPVMGKVNGAQFSIEF